MPSLLSLLLTYYFVHRYGIQVNQLKKEHKMQHNDNLTTLIKATKFILKLNKVPKTKFSKKIELLFKSNQNHLVLL